MADVFGQSLGPGLANDKEVVMGRYARRTRPGWDVRHNPDVRRLQLGWRQDDKGGWAHDGEDERLWEVYCPQCGDTDGPTEYQPPMVRTLRGPYRSEHAARRAAKRHVRDFA